MLASRVLRLTVHTMTLLAALFLIAPALTAAKDQLIRDASGRVAYIVELDPSSANAFAAASSVPDRFPAFNRLQTVSLILAMEGKHGFQAHRMTSWSSTSFTAFLTPAMLDSISKDPRVTMITPDVRAVFSADTTAVWSNVTTGGETQGWGKRATNLLTTASNGNTLVYVIDGGVGQHAELNVVERALPLQSIACGSRTGLSPCTTAQLNYVVGCYTHATAVAGVIGAKAGNSQGIQGIFPNVSIVSVSVLEGNANFVSTTRHCLDANSPTPPVSVASDIKTSIDWVTSDQVNNHTGRPSVVNMSLNIDNGDPNFSALKTDMQTLASSSPGAFIVESAGNNFEDSCTHAYSAQLCLPLTNDGIMVAGAINNHGQPVVPLHGLPGFFEDFPAFGHDAGSNWGLGVEVFAPGENILTTVANSVRSGGSYYQDGTIVYTATGAGSGTSFSAPHVAGLAAYYIETTPSLTSPSAVETFLRGKFFNLGSFVPTGVVSGGVIQASGSTINIATHDPLPVGATRNTPYADLAISDSCWAPMFATAASGCAQLPYTGKYVDVPGLPIARNNGVLTRQVANSPIWLSMDSYGAGNSSCDLSSALQPLGGGGSIAVGARFYGASLSYATVSGSHWTFSSSVCPSATVQLNN